MSSHHLRKSNHPHSPRVSLKCMEWNKYIGWDRLKLRTAEKYRPRWQDLLHLLFDIFKMHYLSHEFLILYYHDKVQLWLIPRILLPRKGYGLGELDWVFLTAQPTASANFDQGSTTWKGSWPFFTHTYVFVGTSQPKSAILRSGKLALNSLSAGDTGDKLAIGICDDESRDASWFFKYWAF